MEDKIRSKLGSSLQVVKNVIEIHGEQSTINQNDIKFSSIRNDVTDPPAPVILTKSSLGLEPGIKL